MKLVEFLEHGCTGILESDAAIIDCNNCKNISITEEEQRKMGNQFLHICQSYRKKCLHRSMDRNVWHIFPCDDCANDEYKKYEDK